MIVRTEYIEIGYRAGCRDEDCGAVMSTREAAEAHVLETGHTVEAINTFRHVLTTEA